MLLGKMPQSLLQAWLKPGGTYRQLGHPKVWHPSGPGAPMVSTAAAGAAAEGRGGQQVRPALH
jgi:hypothetical protein